MELKDLKANPKNPRKVTPAKLKALKRSLEEFGDLGGFVFNRRSGMLVGGHQRAKVFPKNAKVVVEQSHETPTEKGTVAAGYVEIKGERFSYREVDWDEDREKAANIAANKGAGEWDPANLGEWFKDLAEHGFDLDLTMFDASEREAFLKDAETPSEGLTDPDEIPEEVETRCKPGDLWILGEHRLLCGDSSDVELAKKLLDGKTADLVFTDPPYRMQAEGGSNQLVGKAARKLGEAIKHLCEFDPIAFLANLPTVFERGKMNAYIFCNKDLVPDYLKWGVDAGYSFNILFWKKPNAIPLGGSHRPDVEYLLLFRKSGIWNNAVPGVNYSKCLEFGRELSKDHPTMKPVDLICNELLISSNAKSVVVEFFLGSGSTLIACEKTNRTCFGMELDPKYCDVILTRWEKFTGKNAVLSVGNSV